MGFAGIYLNFVMVHDKNPWYVRVIWTASLQGVCHLIILIEENNSLFMPHIQQAKWKKKSSAAYNVSKDLLLSKSLQ
jgi:hypothetical protein